MPAYSVIVPVYNRPAEVDELLESLSRQSFQNFEVLVVEDGSTFPCRDIVNKYSNRLQVRYFFKENTGPGDSRNYGFARATGNYFIIFDSDCVIPADYMAIVDRELTTSAIDAYGGPDAAHPDFSPLQKAISYAMTSLWTTGGIRGKKKHYGKFHPRSFNMGISREVWKATGGFSDMRYGEDIDFSIRIIGQGFKTALIPEAFVYHKRRNNFSSFFRQVHHSGEARIALYRKYPGELKLAHWFPALFVMGVVVTFLVLSWLSSTLFLLAVAALLLYLGLILAGASVQYRSISTGLLAVWASVCMHFGYGTGFLKTGWYYLRGRL
jgi:glycosyltransferase involved in cell wall biosynthesis